MANQGNPTAFSALIGWFKNALGDFETRRIRCTDDGALHVADAPLNFVIYSGGGYTYYCESSGGSALADPAWQVSRKTDATGTITYAGSAASFGAFAFAVTDLTAVAALTYNGGVPL